MGGALLFRVCEAFSVCSICAFKKKNKSGPPFRFNEVLDSSSNTDEETECCKKNVVLVMTQCSRKSACVLANFVPFSLTVTGCEMFESDFSQRFFFFPSVCFPYPKK